MFVLKIFAMSNIFIEFYQINRPMHILIELFFNVCQEIIQLKPLELDFKSLLNNIIWCMAVEFEIAFFTVVSFFTYVRHQQLKMNAFLIDTHVYSFLSIATRTVRHLLLEVWKLYQRSHLFHISIRQDRLWF